MLDARLFPLTGGQRRNPLVDRWFDARAPALATIARHWFDAIRGSGPDVADLLHDGHPTACVGELAFAYVNVFTQHVNVGFFLGAHLPDPASLLEGSGRFMRHVKVTPGRTVEEGALRDLVHAAYADMKGRIAGA